MAPILEFLHVQMVHTDFQRADALEKAFLKGSAHAHGLAGSLHLGTQTVVGIGEFIKGEPGHFGYHIVQGRFKSGAGIGQTDLIQGHAHTDLGGNPGDWVAGGLGSQSGTARDPGVDLDQIVLEGLGIQRELHVAAALDFQRPDQLQRRIPEHVVFLVGQGLRGTHHDGITGVNAHRIQVLHVADGNGRVIGIPHHLVLDFFVALDALFHQHLVNGRQHQGIFHDLPELLLVVGKAAAGAAQGEGRPQYHGIADLLRRRQALLHGVGNLAGEYRLPQALAKLLEQLPILGLFDAAAGSSQQLHMAFLQDTLFLQLRGQIQARLTADAGDDGIGSLVADNPGNVFQGQRLHVDLVRDGGVGHNGCWVGIAEDNLIALLLQGKAGLGSGVVKFRRLANHDGAGADHQNFLQISSFRHVFPPPSTR